MSSRRTALVATGAAVLVAALLLSVAFWPAARKTSAEPLESTLPSPAASADASTGPSASPQPSASAVAPDLAWGPTAAQWDSALTTARALPVADAAGQVIVASVSTPSPGAVEDMVGGLGLGGIIVMADAVTDADGVRELAQAAQAGARSGDRGWGALVGVDQEGGLVSRLRGLMPDLPGFMAAGAARDKAVVRDAYAQAAVDMHAMGFTVDFAPVADATVGLGDPTIRSRSAGSNVERVTATVQAALAGFVDGGVVPVIKHFPGHGSVTADSHEELPVQRVSLADLERRDMLPFAAAVDAGAPAVMMAHIALPEWGEGPASLEPAAYDHLRGELGFNGVAMTDALNMGAIQASHASGAASVQALAAGADLLLMPPDPRAARDAIVAAVDSGEVPRERLDEAAARIILLAQWQAGLDPVDDEGLDYARELATAGVSIAARDCSVPFVGDTVTISGGWDYDRAALAEALGSHGIAVGDEGTSILLVGGDAATGNADVVVAMGAPWGLSESDADVYVGLYGRSDEVLAGLADVLAGVVPPGGEWPVTVSVPFALC